VACVVFVITDDGLLHWLVLVGVIVFCLIAGNGGSRRAAQVGGLLFYYGRHEKCEQQFSEREKGSQVNWSEIRSLLNIFFQ
jgi:hypothetical protein